MLINKIKNVSNINLLCYFKQIIVKPAKAQKIPAVTLKTIF